MFFYKSFGVFTVSSMNKTQKNVPQVKKVPPPAIPDSVACRHSGSSFGSTGYSSSSDDAFLDPNTCIKPGKIFSYIYSSNIVLIFNYYINILDLRLDAFALIFINIKYFY